MSQPPRELGPGGIPFSREEAVEMARGIRRRAATTLEPYMQRAGEAQLAARDDGDMLQKIADRMGVDPQELADTIDVEGSINMSAVVDCLLDLQHACLEMGLDWLSLIQQADKQYRNQAVALARRIVYEVPDMERPEGPSTSIFLGHRLEP